MIDESDETNIIVTLSERGKKRIFVSTNVPGQCLTHIAPSKKLMIKMAIASFRYMLFSSADTYIVDVLWGQQNKLIQVVSTSEFHEY
jgi:ABC-type uncharacterized transport system permease subunit